MAQIEDQTVHCLQSAYLSGPAWGHPTPHPHQLALGLGAAQSWGCSERSHPPLCHFSLLVCRSLESCTISFAVLLLEGGMSISIGFRRNESLPFWASCLSQSPLCLPMWRREVGPGLVRGPAGFVSCCCGFRVLLEKAKLKSGVTEFSGETRECVSHSPAAPPALPHLLPLLLLPARHPHRVWLRARCQSWLSEFIRT